MMWLLPLLTACIPWVGVYVQTADTGQALTVDDLGVGDLVVTEIMAQPQEMPRYVEIALVGTSAVDIGGLEITSGTGRYVVRPKLVMRPGDHAVFGPTGLGNANQHWEEPGPQLAWPDGSVQIAVGDLVIDAVVWDAEWPSVSGSAMVLSASKTDAVSNDDPGSWCTATREIDDKATQGPTNYGSPQLPNLDCPR